MLLPRRLIQDVTSYVEVERAHAVGKFRAREGWRAMHQPIFVRRPVPGARGLALRDGGMIPIDSLDPDERSRLVICGKDGRPTESGVLWLTEIGQPVRPTHGKSPSHAHPAGARTRASRSASARISCGMLCRAHAGDADPAALRDEAHDAEDPARPIAGCSAIPCSRFSACSGTRASPRPISTSITLPLCQDTVDAAVEELLSGIETPQAGDGMSARARPAQRRRVVSFARPMASLGTRSDAVTGLRFTVAAHMAGGPDRSRRAATASSGARLRSALRELAPTMGALDGHVQHLNGLKRFFAVPQRDRAGSTAPSICGLSTSTASRAGSRLRA